MTLLRIEISLLFVVFCFVSAATNNQPSNTYSSFFISTNDNEQNASGKVNKAQENTRTDNSVQNTVEQAKAETIKETADVDICNSFQIPQDKLLCLEIIAQITMNTAATDICNQFTSPQDKLLCLNIIAGKSINDPTKGLCNGFDKIEDKVTCLNMMSGKTISLEAADVCNKLSDPSKKLRCIEITGNKTIYAPAANLCSQMRFSSPDMTLDCLNICVNTDFSPLGVHICSRFYISSKHKLQCLDIIANKQLNETAVAVCESLRSTSPDMTLQCLNDIAGKIFNKADVTACKKMVLAENKLQCIQQIPAEDSPGTNDQQKIQEPTEPNNAPQPPSSSAPEPDIEFNLESNPKEAQPKLQI